MKGIVKSDMSHVEDVEDGGIEIPKEKSMGTVKLTEGKIVYIPTPTADPQGETDIFPLNTG